MSLRKGIALLLLAVFTFTSIAPVQAFETTAANKIFTDRAGTTANGAKVKVTQPGLVEKASTALFGNLGTTTAVTIDAGGHLQTFTGINAGNKTFSKAVFKPQLSTSPFAPMVNSGFTNAPATAVTAGCNSATPTNGVFGTPDPADVGSASPLSSSICGARVTTQVTSKATINFVAVAPGSGLIVTINGVNIVEGAAADFDGNASTTTVATNFCTGVNNKAVGGTTVGAGNLNGQILCTPNQPANGFATLTTIDDTAGGTVVSVNGVSTPAVANSIVITTNAPLTNITFPGNTSATTMADAVPLGSLVTYFADAAGTNRGAGQGLLLNFPNIGVSAAPGSSIGVTATSMFDTAVNPVGHFTGADATSIYTTQNFLTSKANGAVDTLGTLTSVVPTGTDPTVLDFSVGAPASIASAVASNAATIFGSTGSSLTTDSELLPVVNFAGLMVPNEFTPVTTDMRPVLDDAFATTSLANGAVAVPVDLSAAAGFSITTAAFNTTNIPLSLSGTSATADITCTVAGTNGITPVLNAVDFIMKRDTADLTGGFSFEDPNFVTNNSTSVFPQDPSLAQTNSFSFNTVNAADPTILSLDRTGFSLQAVNQRGWIAVDSRDPADADGSDTQAGATVSDNTLTAGRLNAGANGDDVQAEVNNAYAAVDFLSTTQFRVHFFRDVQDGFVNKFDTRLSMNFTGVTSATEGAVTLTCAGGNLPGGTTGKSVTIANITANPTQNLKVFVVPVDSVGNIAFERVADPAIVVSSNIADLTHVRTTTQLQSLLDNAGCNGDLTAETCLGATNLVFAGTGQAAKIADLPVFVLGGSSRRIIADGHRVAILITETAKNGFASAINGIGGDFTAHPIAANLGVIRVEFDNADVFAPEALTGFAGGLPSHFTLIVPPGTGGLDPVGAAATTTSYIHQLVQKTATVKAAVDIALDQSSQTNDDAHFDFILLVLERGAISKTVADGANITFDVKVKQLTTNTEVVVASDIELTDKVANSGTASDVSGGIGSPFRLNYCNSNITTLNSATLTTAVGTNLGQLQSQSVQPLTTVQVAGSGADTTLNELCFGEVYSQAFPVDRFASTVTQLLGVDLFLNTIFSGAAVNLQASPAASVRGTPVAAVSRLADGTVDNTLVINTALAAAAGRMNFVIGPNNANSTATPAQDPRTTSSEIRLTGIDVDTSPVAANTPLGPIDLFANAFDGGAFAPAGSNFSKTGQAIGTTFTEFIQGRVGLNAPLSSTVIAGTNSQALEGNYVTGSVSNTTTSFAGGVAEAAFVATVQGDLNTVVPSAQIMVNDALTTIQLADLKKLVRGDVVIEEVGNLKNANGTDNTSFKTFKVSGLATPTSATPGSQIRVRGFNNSNDLANPLSTGFAGVGPNGNWGPIVVVVPATGGAIGVQSIAGNAGPLTNSDEEIFTAENTNVVRQFTTAKLELDAVTNLVLPTQGKATLLVRAVGDFIVDMTTLSLNGVVASAVSPTDPNLYLFKDVPLDTGSLQLTHGNVGTFTVAPATVTNVAFQNTRGKAPEVNELVKLEGNRNFGKGQLRGKRLGGSRSRLYSINQSTFTVTEIDLQNKARNRGRRRNTRNVIPFNDGSTQCGTFVRLSNRGTLRGADTFEFVAEGNVL